ncbi:ubiquitin carboxyl-terminal hydrolase 37-like [Perca fluviatilis]|uniref:ubiquitin carboxyl-terminal hydrolase 37-like n=1 Tax=Perca fluviatilis TaxID=8168 RepID=UPI001963BB76|nr:ubiquitin carboxyl-terminal hydrolase 37-like [Perca fluviatilis]
MLQDYQREKELEYNCECGATMSGQRSSFLTLPKVLVLHLKRFKFTPSFQLKKVLDPIVLLRELVVSSDQDTTYVMGLIQMWDRRTQLTTSSPTTMQSGQI